MYGLFFENYGLYGFLLKMYGFLYGCVQKCFGHPVGMFKSFFFAEFGKYFLEEVLPLSSHFWCMLLSNFNCNIWLLVLFAVFPQIWNLIAWFKLINLAQSLYLWSSNIIRCWWSSKPRTVKKQPTKSILKICKKNKSRNFLKNQENWLSNEKRETSHYDM